MPTSTTGRRHALIVVAVTVVAALLAGLAIWAWQDTDDSGTGNSPFTSSEQAALDAAQRSVANLASFRRAKFDADFARAESGLTGDVLSNFKQKKTTYKQAVDNGKFDLSAKVTHVALIGRIDNNKVQGYDVLVSFNGYRSTQQNLPSQQNLRVTMQDKGGTWLIADLTSIGVG